MQSKKLTQLSNFDIFTRAPLEQSSVYICFGSFIKIYFHTKTVEASGGMKNSFDQN